MWALEKAKHPAFRGERIEIPAVRNSELPIRMRMTGHRQSLLRSQPLEKSTFACWWISQKTAPKTVYPEAFWRSDGEFPANRMITAASQRNLRYAVGLKSLTVLYLSLPPCR
ncbi:MAG: hypothetical protein DWH78_13250 [Planctomycetota bacterium]|nr:MAG: hypothetical protein DWH78_13250 [Planctomycetota bacterium]